MNRRARNASTEPELGTLLALAGWSRPAWMRDALCPEYPSVDFFPSQGQSVTDALEVCARCLVAVECSAYAISERIDFGIWGGTTARARRRTADERGMGVESLPQSARRSPPTRFPPEPKLSSTRGST